MEKIQAGMTFIPNGSANTEFTPGEGYEFTDIQTITECKFTSITPAPGFSIDNVAAFVIPAGTILRIRATAFKVSHGAMIAYFAKTVDKRANEQ